MIRPRVVVLAAALVTVFLVSSCARGAPAATLPDPGGTAAWGAGLALLADPPGPLAVFDQPARLGFAAGERPRAFALAASRAEWFGVAELARSRVALRWGARALALAVGAERFGPADARLARTSAGASLRVRGLDLGAAWHEARGAGALDLAVATVPRADGVGLAFAAAARAVAAGGDPRARPEPDWTLEGAWRRGGARLHAAVTKDLVSTRPGLGLALERGAFALGAGAFGAPWTWTLAVSWRGTVLAGGYARAVHPVLGASEQAEARLAW
jgi:hypothetical protein